jgi:hypothetical protein
VAAREGAGLDHREHDGEARENVDTGKRDDISSKPIKREVKSWRDVLPVHPAARLFPPMSESKLRELGEDIEENGLSSPIVLWQADENATAVLLDGRNRLDAIEMVIGHPKVSRWSVTVDGWSGMTPSVITLAGHVDPYSYVISANIHRRHLNAEQKRDLIAKLLKAQPEKSDRQIGKQAGVSHPTIAKARKQAEATGKALPVEKRTGADGKARKQPAKKSTKKAERRHKAREYRAAKEAREREAAAAEDRADLAAYEAEAEQIAADLLKQIDRNLAQRLHALLPEGMCLKEALGRGLGLEGDAVEDVKPEGNGADHPQASADQRKAEFAKLDDGIPDILRRRAPEAP